MTLKTLNVQKAYDGDGVDKVFPIDFDFWETAEVEVLKRVKTTGVEALQIEDIDYTIENHVLGSTGDVDFTIDADGPPAATEEVHLRRVSLTTQVKDLSPATKVPTEAIEEGLDRLAARYQEVLADMAARALVIPVTDIPVSGDAPDMEIPSTILRAVPNAVLGFDSVTGNPTIVAGATLPSVTVSAFGADLVDEVSAATARALLEAVENGSSSMDKIESFSLLAAVPAAATFGSGMAFARNTRELQFSDGASYRTAGMLRSTNAGLPASLVAGPQFFDTDNLTPLFDDGAALIPWRTPLTRGAIGGLGLSLSGTDQDVNIAVGECRAGTSADRSLVNGLVATALVKEMDGAGNWVAGANNLGRPSGDALAPDKWHHVHLLVHPAGNVDAGVDDDINAATLLADANVIAAGFTRFRYLGSVKETAAGDGTLLPFIQVGNLFIWTTIPGLDVDLGDADYSGADTNIALSFVPPDVRCMAHVVARSDAAAQFLWAHGGVTIGADPNTSTTPLAMQTVIARYQLQLLTDTSGQVVVRGDAADPLVQLDLEVHGYENFRGAHD